MFRKSIIVSAFMLLTYSTANAQCISDSCGGTANARCVDYSSCSGTNASGMLLCSGTSCTKTIVREPEANVDRDPAENLRILRRALAGKVKTLESGWFKSGSELSEARERLHQYDLYLGATR